MTLKFSKISQNPHGDTIIEVIASISVFSMVALISLTMMNSGLSAAQRTLETTMARTAIDAQAESLRFIHESYIAERSFANSITAYSKLWKQLIQNAGQVSRNGLSGDSFNVNSYNSCNEAYAALATNSFVVNPRLLVPQSISALNPESSEVKKYMNKNYENPIIPSAIKTVSPSNLSSSTLYPRLIYKSWSGGATNENSLIAGNSGDREAANKLFQQIERIEGIWLNVYYSENKKGQRDAFKHAEYYDFFIRTCWESPGSKAPSTITTTVRLYNPEIAQ